MSYVGAPKKGLIQVSKKTLQRLENLSDRTGKLGLYILQEAFKDGEETEEALLKYIEQEEAKLN